MERRWRTLSYIYLWDLFSVCFFLYDYIKSPNPIFVWTRPFWMYTPLKGKLGSLMESKLDLLEILLTGEQYAHLPICSPITRMWKSILCLLMWLKWRYASAKNSLKLHVLHPHSHLKNQSCWFNFHRIVFFLDSRPIYNVLYFYFVAFSGWHKGLSNIKQGGMGRKCWLARCCI